MTFLGRWGVGSRGGKRLSEQGPNIGKTFESERYLNGEQGPVFDEENKQNKPPNVLSCQLSSDPPPKSSVHGASSLHPIDGIH